MWNRLGQTFLTVMVALLLVVVIGLSSCHKNNPPDAVKKPIPTPTPVPQVISVDDWNANLVKNFGEARDLQHKGSQIIGNLDAFRPPKITPEMLFQSYYLNYLPTHTEPSPEQILFSTFDAPENITPEMARMSERNDEEWIAGKEYFVLGDHKSVMRCARELERELEWEAAAQLYVLEEDVSGVDRCLDRLLEGDMVTRAHAVIEFIIGQRKWSLMDHSLEKRGWNLETIIEPDAFPFVLRTLAESGRTEPLRKNIQNTLEVWRNTNSSENDLEKDILLNIVVLGDLSLARQYLEIPSANVGFFYWCGEGCGIAWISALAEFRNLIDSDPALVELFERRTHEFVEDINTLLVQNHEGSISTRGLERDWIIPDDELWSWLIWIGRDQKLKRLWTRELRTVDFHNPIVKEIGLWILAGESPQLTPNMEVRERLLIAVINGLPLSKAAPIDMIIAPTYQEVIPHQALSGTLQRELGLRLWQEKGLPTATIQPGAIYRTEADIEEALELIDRISSRTGDNMTLQQVVTDLAISGHMKEIPSEWMGVGPVPWIAAQSGDMGPISEALYGELREELRSVGEKYRGAIEEIEHLLRIPINRVYGVVISPAPEGDGLYAMLKPHLEVLQVVSEHTYLHFMAYVPPEVRDAEVRRLAASGQVRLANMMLDNR